MPKSNAKNAAPQKKPAPKKPKTVPAEPAAAEQEVRLAGLDLTPAEAVRSRATDAARRRIAEAVGRYAALDREQPGGLPAVRAFKGKTVTLVGDGSCRVNALRANGRDTVRALVSRHKTDADARSAARRCAWTANLAHGLHLEDDDKRLIVRDILTSQAADPSDYRVKKLTGFSNVLIRGERERMTRDGVLPPGDPRRADTPGRYDPDAKQRGGVPPPAAASPPPVVQADVESTRMDYSNGGANEPATAAEPGNATPSGGCHPLAAGSKEPDPPAAYDDKSKPVPERLAGLFAERPLIAAAVQTLASMVGAKSLPLIPEFAELAAEADRLAGRLNQIRPRFVCDRCDGAGTEAGGVCPECKGLGWGVNTTTGTYADPVSVPPDVAERHPAAEAEPDAPGAIPLGADAADDEYEWLVPDSGSFGDRDATHDRAEAA